MQNDGERIAGTNITNSVEERNQIQIERCLLFIKENVSAATAFYGTFFQFASIGSAAKVKLKTTFKRMFNNMMFDHRMMYLK